MHHDDFNAIFEATVESSRDVLVQKADEYATDDRLHNFKVAAALEPGGTARSALAGMMRKHTVSVYDMCYSDKEFTQEQWDEKIGDHINYLILLRAIVLDEMHEDEPDIVITINEPSGMTTEQRRLFAAQMEIHGYGPSGRKRFR